MARASAAGGSLQQRLQWQLLLGLVVMWLLGAGASAVSLWLKTGEVLDAGLDETAEHLLMLPDAVLDQHETAEQLSRFGAHSQHVVYQVADAQGRVRLRSQSAPEAPLDPQAGNGVRTNGPWHVLTQWSADGRLRAQVAEPLSRRRAALWSSLAWQLLPLVAMLPVATVLLRLALRRGFAWLEATRAELQHRSPQRLDALDTHGCPTELQPWLSTVNQLLERVRGQIEAERTFAANTAHELRTPLAAAQAQAQHLAHLLSPPAGSAASAGPPSAQAREAAEALRRQLDRLTRLATRLLELARIDAGVALRHDTVDLVALALLVLDDFADAQRSGRLQVQVDDRPLPVQGDIDALGIALRNLVDNALKHGGDQARVVVSVKGRCLVVQDDGPGVTASELSGLARKFSRAGPRNVPGVGLGLQMVQTIATQSGARLRLQSPVADGHGFSAALDFSSPA